MTNDESSSNDECVNDEAFVIRHSNLIRHSTFVIRVSAIAALACGCGNPSRANIELRKQVQQLQGQVSSLQRQHDADQRLIQGLRDRQGTIPTLPTTRLSRLFTTHGLEFGRLTGGADLDSNKPGDEGLLLYMTPVDETGQPIKAAGSFDVEAFDLAEPADPRIGHWHFDLQQSRASWNGFLLDYGYILTCPWQKKVPRHRDITVRVTFSDELTQIPFTAQRVVRINPPPEAPASPR